MVPYQQIYVEHVAVILPRNTHAFSNFSQHDYTVIHFCIMLIQIT